MLITIASLDAKEKLTFITTTENRKLRCWNDKVGRLGLEQGGTYEIETEATDYGTHVTKAKRVTAPPAAAATSAAPAAPAVFRTPEQMTATEIVCAYIAAGKCADPANLRRTMQEAVNAFRAIWPDEDHYREAAE